MASTHRFDAGLVATINWYKAHPERWEPKKAAVLNEAEWADTPQASAPTPTT